MSQVHCFIVSATAQDEKLAIAAKLAGQSGFPASVAPDLAGLSTEAAFTGGRQPLVVLLDHGPGGASAEAAIAFAEEQAGHAFLIYVAETIAPDDYKRLLRRQSADWCRWDDLPRELSDAALRLAGGEAVSRGARVVSFLPSKGGVGNTTLAIETAVHLATQRKRGGARIAILDLNLDGGTLADALDAEPRFDLRELAGRPERLDVQLIDIFASRHSDRLDIFASPSPSAGAADVDPQMIFAVLDLMAQRYDLILLDIPNQRLAWIDNLLQGSDGIVVCGGSTVPELKKLATRLTQLDRLAVEARAMVVAVNRCETNAFGRFVRRQEIERALPGRAVFLVRQDDVALREAHNTGRPLSEVSPGKRVGKDMRQIADWIETTMGRRGGASAKARA
jgi:pilus assembly protein CpaE